MARALLVGRFQPFHLGHLEVARGILEAHDSLVVGIGSSEASHTAVNPFTAGERVEMIHDALAEADLPQHLLVPIPDIHRNALWVRHVESLVPRFDVLYSNNGLPRRLFAEAGYEVRGLPFHHRNRFSGTRIRHLMETDGDWEPLVPSSVARVVREVDGPQRLRDIHASDRPAEEASPDLVGDADDP